MKKYCFEGNSKTKADWLNWFGIGANDFQVLLDEGIFRPLPKNNSNRQYSIQLVGLAYQRDHVLVSFPKIFENCTLTEKLYKSYLCDTIRLIQAYRLRKSSFLFNTATSQDFFSDTSGFRLVDIFISLVKWTDEYGLHTEDSFLKCNQAGAIDWPSTIRSSLPIHNSSGPIYDSPVLKKRTIHLGSLAAYQAKAIVDISKLLGPISDIVTSSYTNVVNLSHDFLNNYGDIEKKHSYICSDIKNFQQTTNRDHESALSKLLLSYYSSCANSFSSKYNPIIFGTSSFHTIWQEMCQKMLMQYSKSIDFKSVSSSLLHHTGKKSTNWLSPDHVLESKVHKGHVMIFDSKWHLPFKEFHSSDIVKQMIYELSCNKKVSTNALLVPTLERSVKDYGNIQEEKIEFSEDAFPEIKVIGVPWNSVVANFLNNGSLNLSENIAKCTERFNYD